MPATLVLPGNHDIPLFNLVARLLAPYAHYERAFGTELEPAFTSADLLVVGVNTTRPSRHKDGEVSAGQIARVSGRLKAGTRRTTADGGHPSAGACDTP